MKRSESFFRGYDQTKLYLQKWDADQPCGTILFSHGQAEHSDCYNRLINGFQKSEHGKNWSFIGWDMRGHGKSEGVRGYAKDFDEYVLDYHLFLDECLNIDSVKSKPVILLAHSMGGLIQACALREKKYDQFKAQVLSSPLFGISQPIPAWKESSSEILNALLPKVTLGNEITNEQLTRDPEVIKEYEQDTYRHNKISAGVFLGFKREFDKIASTAGSITLPTLLHISDDDPVVSTAQAKLFFENLATTDKVLKIYDGGKHELYNDIVRDDVYNVVIDFINKHK
ncbi:MAG: lysophospholipase [Bdellovibrionota bacterium]